MTYRHNYKPRLSVLTAASLIALAGCWQSSGPQVVVYSALDREFSEPCFEEFETQTGISVLAKYDIESTKTVGLVNAIIQEQSRPRCDVFWNNEILHTLRLQKLGLLETYFPPTAEKFPKQYRSADGQWHGFAARARVLIVSTRSAVLPKDRWPDSIHDLTDADWKGKVGIAKPLFGTTATHAAVLFSHWGDEQAKEFFRTLAQNAQILSGNKQVAEAVASGELAFGLTDTDDAIIEKEDGMPVEIVFPDQGDDQMGTLLIPNTLCLIKGSPHPEQARRLIDYLFSAEVESRLAEGRSAQFPLHTDAPSLPRVAPDEPTKWMDVDFNSAADRWETAAKFLSEELAASDQQGE